MNDKPSIQSYQDLKVWQEAMNLAEECYRVTKQFPKEETYGMISQIRRASVSIPANIAEGYGRRTRGEKKGVGGRVSGVGNTALDEASNLAQCKRLEKGEASDPMVVGASLFPYTRHPAPYTRPNGAGEYIQFLYIAQGSLKELETHLLLSIRVALAVAEVINPVINQCKLVGKILLGLIRSLESRA